MVVLAPQPLEIGAAKSIEQVVGQPCGAVLVTPGGAVEPALVKAGEDQSGVDRLAGSAELHDDAGGLDASSDSFCDQRSRRAEIDLPRCGPASHEGRADEQHALQHDYARRRRYSRTGERSRTGARSIASATMMPTTGPSVHRPPNQCCTAVYQRTVVGRKMKPARSQGREEDIP